MVDFKKIYRTQAAEYDLLVTREDYQGNLLAALQKIHPLAGSDVVEFGAGTGRVTRLLVPLVNSIIACDISPHMLQKAVQRFQTAHLTRNWNVAIADNRAMPIKNQSADVVLAGWSFGHSMGWYPQTWREEVDKALGEMKRLLRPGGTAVIIETMGTGFYEAPTPPAERHALYYGWLENERGFSATAVATDYEFESVQEADTLTRFFFGDALADRLVQENRRILPEFTGFWWRTF